MTDASDSAVELRVNAERSAWTILIVCLLIEIAFVILDYFVSYGRATDIGAIRRMFNTAREDGLASWFAVTQTLLIGLTLWLTCAIAKNGNQPRARVLGWAVLAMFFTYMAIDDGAQIHERLGTTFKAIREASGATVDFFPSYTWQLIFLPVFAGLGLFTLWFLWLELGDTMSRVFLLGALSLLVLAVGFDFIEGLDDDHPWNAYTWLCERYDIEPWTRARFGTGDFNTLRHFSKSIEEAMEMAANSLFWFIFLRHLPSVSEEFRVRFVPKKTSSSS